MTYLSARSPNTKESGDIKDTENLVKVTLRNVN